MLKMTSVFLFAVMFVTGTMHAQTLEKLAQPKVSQNNLRQIFLRETEKIKKESSVINVKKMEKASRQSMRNGLTSKEKTFLILFIAGLAVLVVLLIKYGKNCVRYVNNCSPSFDENCYCEEYEKEEESRQMLVSSFQRSVPQFGNIPQFNRKLSMKLAK